MRAVADAGMLVNPFNVQFAVRLAGPLQPLAVEQALAALQRRHETLRTVFGVDANGAPAPVVTPADACDLQLSIVDLPFDILARAVEEDSGTPRSKIFQVFVLWQAAPSSNLRMPLLGTSLYEATADGPSVVLVRNRLELRFELVERPDTVTGHITYNMARFSGAAIDGFVTGIERCVTLAERDRRTALRIASPGNAR